jgi:hypothetical protein
MDDARGLVGDSINRESYGKWILHAYMMKVIAEMRVRMEYLCFTDQLAAFSGSSGPSKSTILGSCFSETAGSFSRSVTSKMSEPTWGKLSGRVH